MTSEDSNVKEKLIEAGKSEFLRCGYEKASLRHISTLAQVSTGAIYYFFQSKEDFFRGILEETAVTWKALLQKYTESEVSGSRTSAENDKELITFLFAHKSEAILLFERAEGTVYESYKEELCKILEDAFMVFYNRFGGRTEDSNLIKIVVRMRMQGYFELLHGDYTVEQALKYSELLAHYGDSGFEGMMKQYNKVLKGSVE